MPPTAMQPEGHQLGNSGTITKDLDINLTLFLVYNVSLTFGCKCLLGSLYH